MTVMEPVIAWLMNCQEKTITLDQVMTGSDRPRRPVLRVLDRLVREGYLEEVEDNKVHCRLGECGPPRRNPTWNILDKPLSVPDRKVKRVTLRDKIWKIIRAKRHFTVVGIQRLSGGCYDTVRKYINMLERDGYVRRTGTDGNRVTWMLVKGHKQAERPVTEEDLK